MKRWLSWGNGCGYALNYLVVDIIYIFIFFRGLSIIVFVACHVVSEIVFFDAFYHCKMIQIVKI